MTRYVVDESVRRVDDGRVIIGGSPLSLFRLTVGGAAMFDRLAAGDDVGPNVLLSRLLAAGAVHPIVVPAPAGDVTVVIPAFDVGREELGRLVASLVPVGRVVVIDDGSTPPVGPVDGAEVVRRAVNGGPGAARMTGLASVTTEFVAFVDTDVTVSPGWLEPLIGHFADADVDLVAARVASAHGAGLIARYDATRSPLDLGPRPGPVIPGSRISYVPGACVVARSAAIRDIGGFDADLRTGEDVDLVWRLVAGGRSCRYESASVVTHRARPTLVAWLRQRVGYGRSAGPLARRHPGAVAPLVMNRWSAVVWGLVAAGSPVAAVSVGAATTMALAHKLDFLQHQMREAARLGGLGHLYAGRQVASAIGRVWWPLFVPAALVSRRARRVLVAALVLPPAIDWATSRPPIDLPRYVGLRILDDGAYSIGVWRSLTAARTIGPLVPSLTSSGSSTPGRRRGRASGSADRHPCRI